MHCYAENAYEGRNFAYEIHSIILLLPAIITYSVFGNINRTLQSQDMQQVLLTKLKRRKVGQSIHFRENKCRHSFSVLKSVH